MTVQLPLVVSLVMWLIPSVGAQRECDPMEKAFAPDCCPVREPSVAAFCESLFGRPHYSSTGMIENHEGWIGGYGIAETLPEETPLTPPRDDNSSMEAGVTHVIAKEPETNGEEILLLPVPSEEVEEKPQDEKKVEAEEGQGCDAMTRAFAPACCPVEDPTFAAFCESLLGRETYNRTRNHENIENQSRPPALDAGTPSEQQDPQLQFTETKQPNNQFYDPNLFDPTDLKYQASKDYAPDKEKLWQFPPENDGWIHAHNALRGELQMIQDCFEAIQKQANNPSSVSLSEWQVKALQMVFDAHYHFIHAHHSNEDAILVPKLNERFLYPETLTSDHVGIAKAMASLKVTIHSLRAGDDSTESMTSLLEDWNAYRTDLEEHLLEEEEIGLPLARAYFTPREFRRIVREITFHSAISNWPTIARDTKLEIGSFVYHMGAQQMRSEYMRQEGIPFFVWPIVFHGALTLYERRVVELANALKTGVPPQRGMLGFWY